MRFIQSLQIILPATLLCMAAQGASVFNFDSDALGTVTGFTDLNNGISAAFSSPGDPGGFVIYPSIFETLTGNVLGDPGPGGANGLDFSIAFNANVSAITLDFATSDFSTPSPLTLNAYEGSSTVGSTTTTGSFLSGFVFPEGEIAFSGSSFNNVRIFSTATDFAVDNVTVLPVVTAEPGSLALLGCALCSVGLPFLRRRARSRRCSI